jgi:hypothetical protein
MLDRAIADTLLDARHLNSFPINEKERRSIKQSPWADNLENDEAGTHEEGSEVGKQQEGKD